MTLQVGVALGTGAGLQRIITQRAGPLVVGVGGAVCCGGLAHMAVSTAEGVCMNTARTHVGLEFRVLYLDLTHTGSGIGVICEDLSAHGLIQVLRLGRISVSGREAIFNHGFVVIEVQNGIRGHGVQTLIRQRGD